MLAIIFIFLSLALDTLAVAFGLGLKRLPRHKWLNVGITFSFFEGIMPVLGLFIGNRLSTVAGAYTGYAAAVLLVVVGLLEVREGFNDDDDEMEHQVPDLKGTRLLMTGLSVSLDELAIGFSLGLLHVPLGPAVAFIAVQALAITFIGLSLGQRIGHRVGERAELLAGIVLTLLGVGLFVNQLFGGRL